MNTPENIFFERYRELRNEIEASSGKLAKEHSVHMKCKKGCDLCCMDYSIFPIEFHFIVNELNKKQLNFSMQDDSETDVCAFLKNHACSIYEQRPIICRTHGLPLLFMNDDTEWELSVCDLNFTEFDFQEFTLDNTFSQDKYNSKLFMLNKNFITQFEPIQYKETDLIPIRNLLKYLEL